MPRVSVRATRHGLAPSLGEVPEVDWCWKWIGLGGGERSVGLAEAGIAQRPAVPPARAGGLLCVSRAESGFARGEPAWHRSGGAEADVLEDPDRGRRLVENVEVHAGHSAGNELLNLTGRVLDARLELGLLVVAGRLECTGERLR